MLVESEVLRIVVNDPVSVHDSGSRHHFFVVEV